MGIANYEHSVLAQLRAQRFGYQHHDATASTDLAERQAALLLDLMGDDPRTIDQAIQHLPRITVLHANIPTSGLSVWDGHQWIITLNRREPRTRQRFTLFHEYKHIVDHPSVDWMYRDGPNTSAIQQAERAADYFAGCVLVPEAMLTEAWIAGQRHPTTLAKHFAVSTRAIKVRLIQVGLVPSPAVFELPAGPKTEPTSNPAPGGLTA